MKAHEPSAKPAGPPELLPAIFLLSLASIALEIALVRIFSISQWNHLAFMVISIALLGFAAGGTLLCIQQVRSTARYPRGSLDPILQRLVLLFALATILALLVLQLMPLDYFRLPLEPIQAGYLLIAFVLLAWPFFCTGLAIAIAYAFQPQQSGRIYFATMSGSAAGALVPFPFLPLVGETGLMLAAALLPIGSLCLKHLLRGPALRIRTRSALQHPAWLNMLALCIVITSAGLLFANRSGVTLKPSPYKALSQQLMLPQTSVSSTFHSIRGRYDVLHSPFIRFAPGLSLKYSGTLPLQTAFYKDADNQIVLYSGPPSQIHRYVESTLAFVGYRLVSEPAHVLVILNNGGASLPCALGAKPVRLNVVTPAPIAARMIERHYGLPVISQNPRVYLKRTPKRFDVIHLENRGSSLPGASALDNENTLTIEAFTLYLEHLKPDGILLITRKLLLPPADSIRLWATAYESLKASGHTAPASHIAVLRNWDTYLLLVSAKPLVATAGLEKIARQLNFDVVYLPVMASQQPNRYNVFKAPFHYKAIQNLRDAYRKGEAVVFFKRYLLDVAPQSDHRPFPGRLLKWNQISQYYQTMGSRFYTLLLSGEVIVVVVLIEALAVSTAILILPLFFLRRSKSTLPWPDLLFFLNVGFGFMLVELFFINAYALFFNEAAVSLTVVLAGILISSSVGGYFSQHLNGRQLRHGIILLILLLAFLWLTLDQWRAWCLTAPDWGRHLLALGLLFPAGCLLGLPFPLGMRLLLSAPTQRAHAWAINGCASVVTSVAAMQLAISLGLPALLQGAILTYTFAFLALGFRK